MKRWIVLMVGVAALGFAAWAERQRPAEREAAMAHRWSAGWRDDGHGVFRAIAYEPEQRLLTVEFRQGYAYRYRDVPRERFLDFCSATAKGAFYNERVRGRYDMERAPDRCLTRPAPAPEPGPRASLASRAGEALPAR